MLEVLAMLKGGARKFPPLKEGERKVLPCLDGVLLMGVLTGASDL